MELVVVLMNTCIHMYMLLFDMHHVVLLLDAGEVKEVVNIFHRLLFGVSVGAVDIVQQ
jgi:hypothetical protein